MLDLILRDAQIIDGTGSAPVHGDLAIDDGRVVGIGRVAGRAFRDLNVGGQVVAPGFIDVHTHYDAQVFWDGTLSPSPLHGVTSVFAGNCGFTLAPIIDGGHDYLLRMLARVEGMPLEALEASLPFSWRSTEEFLTEVEGSLSPNIGFMVGHSALRCAVMDDGALAGPASQRQIQEMAELLASGLRAGAMGFSSTWSRSHNDHNGLPVPSRHSNFEELLALSSVLQDHPGTSLEFIPGVPPFDEEDFRVMGAMSAIADRPLNWNMLQVYEKNRELVDHQLDGSGLAAEEGGAVVALTLPDSFRTWLNFLSGFILDILPGWERLMALPADEKLAQLRSEESRREMNRLAQTASGQARSIANWKAYVIVESPSMPLAVGKTVAELAAAAGRTPWDTLADLIVADELRTVITMPESGQSRADWERRVDVWRDPRAVVGASDAGAHLDMIDSFSYCTRVIQKAVREYELISLEEMVHLLTQRPAALYGLIDRGIIREGSHADLVVFDPDSVAPEPSYMRYDMPTGSGRIYGGATGVNHVLVSGVEIVSHGQFTDARPGRVLRSGADTETVTAAALMKMWR